MMIVLLIVAGSIGVGVWVAGKLGLLKDLDDTDFIDRI